MSYSLLYSIIFLGIVFLTFFSPKKAYMFLVSFLPLSHYCIQMAIVGYDSPRLMPLLLTVGSISCLSILLLKDLGLILDTMAMYKWVLFPFGTFFLMAFTINFFHNGFTFTVQLLDNFLGPICLFIISCVMLRKYPLIINPSFNILILIAIVGFFYGCFEYITGLNPIIHDYLKTITPPLLLNTPGERVNSFFGNFLFSGTFYLFAMMIVFAFSSGWRAFNLGIMFYIGILMTQSRAAIILGACVLLYFWILAFLRDNDSFKNVKRGIVLTCFLLLTVIFISRISFFQATTSRFHEAPIWHRINAIMSFKFAGLVGDGIGEARRISEWLGSISGMENPWAYLAQDFGLVATGFYLMSIFMILLIPRHITHLRNGPAGRLTRAGMKFFFVILLLMVSTYNGFGTRGNVNYLIWYFASLLITYNNRTPH